MDNRTELQIAADDWMAALEDAANVETELRFAALRHIAKRAQAIVNARQKERDTEVLTELQRLAGYAAQPKLPF